VDDPITGKINIYPGHIQQLIKQHMRLFISSHSFFLYLVTLSTGILRWMNRDSLNLQSSIQMENYKMLVPSEEKGVTILTIHRPESLNALSTGLFLEMKNFLKKYDTSTRPRCLIITGEDKAFVAGADIAEMVHMTSEDAELYSRRGQEVFSMIAALNAPVIAAVNGYALGGGCELALACDVRIASNKAKFGQPEVNLGLIPGFAGTQRLPAIAGLGNAMYYLLTGDYMSAAEAYRIGLVQMVTEPDQLMEESLKLAQKILKKGPLAVRKMKKVCRLGLSLGIEEGSILETREFGSLFGNEGTEGMKAFLEKRDPDWSKK